MGNTKPMTDLSEIRRKGIKALVEALGPTGMAYFFMQFDQGSGNYTAERHAWLDTIDEEEAYRLIGKTHKS
ncbi:MAG: hypothetical protein LBM56_05285 [Burkholderiaceae bacterium]|jgi:hypothetical protein|nr:hypothetical protein [Burkholderiaceae bacterium]